MKRRRRVVEEGRIEEEAAGTGTHFFLFRGFSGLVSGAIALCVASAQYMKQVNGRERGTGTGHGKLKTWRGR